MGRRRVRHSCLGIRHSLGFGSLVIGHSSFASYPEKPHSSFNSSRSAKPEAEERGGEMVESLPYEKREGDQS